MKKIDRRSFLLGTGAVAVSAPLSLSCMTWFERWFNTRTFFDMGRGRPAMTRPLTERERQQLQNALDLMNDPYFEPVRLDREHGWTYASHRGEPLTFKLPGPNDLYFNNSLRLPLHLPHPTRTFKITGLVKS